MLGTVKLKVKSADGGKLEPPILLTLLAKGSTHAAETRAISEEGDATAQLDAGDYRINASLSGGQAMVFSVLTDGKPVPGNQLHVPAGASVSVTAIIGRGSGKLEGFAKDNAKPAPGAMILLLPADPIFRAEYAWRDQSDLDGSFHLTNIPAGHYILLAIQNAWDLDWRRDETLAHYLPLALQVVIPDSAATIKFPNSVPAQPR